MAALQAFRDALTWCLTTTCYSYWFSTSRNNPGLNSMGLWCCNYVTWCKMVQSASCMRWGHWGAFNPNSKATLSTNVKQASHAFVW